MKTKRNKFVDILRVFALVYVLMYHIYVVTGMSYKYNIINSILSFGGEIGVSIFFVISGFSIYRLLAKENSKSYFEYIKGRFKKIAPNYYISIIVCLLFTNAATYVSSKYLLNLLSHIFLFHNLFYECHGAINGVLWTMGVTFQFYLIAPLIKKIMDNHPFITTIFSIIITILIKYIIFFIIFSRNSVDEFYYFIYGRQLFTTIDAFVLGMLVAKYENIDVNKKISTLFAILSVFGLCFLILYGSNYITVFGISGIYTNSKKSLLFFIAVDFCIALSIFSFSKLDIKDTKINKILLYLSKHEYAIYIWHLVILNTVSMYSSIITDMKEYSITFTYFIMLFLLISFGCLFDIVISNINFEKVIKEIIETFNSIKNYLIWFLLFILIYISITYIPNIVNNFKSAKSNARECTGACLIAKNAEYKMKCNKICKYAYIDAQDTGFSYFYAIRYYLSPYIAEDYNKYAYVINYSTEQDFLKYIKNLDVDYVIVKSNTFMEKNGYELNEVEGNIFTINKEAKEISKLFVEVQ